MNENLYAEHPDAYDALYSNKNYDAEVEFVASQFEDAVDTPPDAASALVVGCGTGEHSKRLRDRGFEVLGVDKYPAMVERAREKSNAEFPDAEFRVGALPDLGVEGAFDLVWLPFTVIQHLRPDQLGEAFRTLADRLADGGLLVFDQILSDGGHDPHLWTYPTEAGTYARLSQIHEVGDAEHRYDAVVFTPDGDFFVDTHLLVDYDPQYLTGVCDALGLAVELHGWYDEDADPGEDGHVAFVARSES